MSSPYSTITGFGSYVPERILTNKDLEKFVETSNDWILKKVGIEKRHIIGENETLDDMAINAAKKALEDANRKPEDIDHIIVATNTQPYLFPNLGSTIQNRLGAIKATAPNLQGVVLVQT
ncbi:MAG: hypothetical protein QXG00_03735 [Candidatus Woesearchaeota archaeon]